MTESRRLTGIRLLTRSQTGSLYLNEMPKFRRRSTLPSQSTYCTSSGRSRPYSFSISSRRSTLAPSPAISITGLPGIRYSMLNTRKETHSTSATPISNRFTMYRKITAPFHAASAAPVSGGVRRGQSSIYA